MWAGPPTDSVRTYSAVDIGTFNTAPADDVTDSLRACVDVPDWGALLLAGRPYSDVDDIVRRADYLARRWSPGDVLRALAAHPRIGQRASGTGAEAALSAREQGGVLVDDEVTYRLRAGNVEYERRFDHVFLIRAAGRSGHEILAELYRRLGNDDTTEFAETADELRDIALLRLRAVLAA
jgi:2-oxo-4-hydroxy-4-carboxy-5-ureidoimidazoline decarboxylase